MKPLNLNREQIGTLLSHLRTQVVKITFVKKDETRRLMLCTLNPTLIPEEHHPKGTEAAGDRTELEPDERPAVRVYDTINIGWRTVIFDAILEVELDSAKNGWQPIFVTGAEA